VSTANSSLAFDEINEQEEVPMLNLLVKARHLTHKIQEESSADYVITGTITVSF
jgi:hypothetical protein